MTVYTTGLTILAISIIGGLGLVKKNRALNQTVSKIMMFGLYFWLLVFIQCIVASVIYQLLYK